MIDLDHNATTKPAAEVVAAVVDALQRTWANPSSVHRAGQDARHAVELARQRVARLIGAKPKSITFTGSGTEAIDLSIRGTLAARRAAGGGGGVVGERRPVLVTTAVEHAAVRDLARELERTGEAEVRWLPVDGAGRVVVDRLGECITPGVAVVSVQWANNETGVVQPIAAVRAACRAASGNVGGVGGAPSVVFHCDATQWVGKMPTDVREAGGGPAGVGGEEAPADLITFSPHKFHGPKGVGVLWSRPGVRWRPLVRGAQERGLRGGTENVPGIVGAGVAAELARAWLTEERDEGGRAGGSAERVARCAALRDEFERGVLESCPGAVVNGAGVERLWNTTNIAFPKLEAEALLLAMSERGLAASAGAACSSGSLEPSPVLLAMGVPAEWAHGSIRFSTGRETTAEELAGARLIVAECVRRLRGSMP
jgi:cysteine desulfurase